MTNGVGAGTAPRVVDEHLVAVYDPKDGRVLHLHAWTVFEGGQSVSEEEAVEEALKVARQHGHRTEGAQTLHTTQGVRGPHRVDLATLALVLLDRPRRG